MNAECPPIPEPDERSRITHFQNKERDCRSVAGLDGSKGVDCHYKVNRNGGIVGGRPLAMHKFQRLDSVSNEHQLVGAFFAELAYLEEAAVSA